MLVVKVQFHILDKEHFFLPKFEDKNIKEVKVKDKVIVKTDLGQDLGIIRGKVDINKDEVEDANQMLRLANEDDFKKMQNQKKEYKKYLDICRNLIREGRLDMKLVDVYQSFDNKRLIFYFVSNSRIDFRDLVKKLIGVFHKKIRLQQTNISDESKIEGDYGPFYRNIYW